jgi:hypothetical protein
MRTSGDIELAMLITQLHRILAGKLCEMMGPINLPAATFHIYGAELAVFTTSLYRTFVM